ncbi:MAG: glucuronate isomerase [Bryobacteraceae bacterium]|nr:glucuronate isomerase [Bryobacteraceae bacterium]
MPFIHDDFLLTNPAARRLYHEYARDEPILDYHCHLPPRDIAENRRFQNVFEAWLEGDHYKWRAMRANGYDESYCTGDVPPYEKFMAWARTVPYTLRNPLYHWTHLELKRYFDIDDLLDEHTGPAIWERTGRMLASDELSAQGILKKFNVRALCTTDDPTDDLSCHRAIAASGLETRVFPTFRPDKAMMLNPPQAFNAWTDRLGEASNVDIRNLSSFVDALTRRHDYFHEMGCRLSDHGIGACYSRHCPDGNAAAIFDKARSGRAVDSEEQDAFDAFLMLLFGRLDAQRGWTKQLHLGARRNANSRMLERLGPDTGFDSMADGPQIEALATYLDRLDRENALPKTILYANSPACNYTFTTLMGCFQDGSVPGKMQFGSGWWHLDQKEGMEAQLNALSNTGLLSRFVGMLTDSRSFLSYPRHEYFRRVLCNLVGRDLEAGELPDLDMAGAMIRNICYANAKAYLDLPF